MPIDRRRLLDELNAAMRVNALRAAMFHYALATRLGLTITEFNCLNVLGVDGSMTPGQLAKRVGVTRGGAITTVLDRLERAGYIERRRSDEDRRQVIVKLVEEAALPPVRSHFEAFFSAWEEHLAGYRDDELVLLVDFATMANRVIHKTTLDLQEDD